jgi:hypothetical protein
LAAEDYYTVAPCRLLDTRISSNPVQTNTLTLFTVGGLCGIPTFASSVSFNVTLVPQNVSVDLGAFPGDLTTPPNTNVVSGQSVPIASAAIIPLSIDGQATVGVLANSVSSGATDLLLDVSGYFLPDTNPLGWPGPTDSDPGPSDNFASETYTDTLGQPPPPLDSPVALVPGQGGAGSHYFLSTSKE